jgi:hypothetical protein
MFGQAFDFPQSRVTCHRQEPSPTPSFVTAGNNPCDRPAPPVRSQAASWRSGGPGCIPGPPCGGHLTASADGERPFDAVTRPTARRPLEFGPLAADAPRGVHRELRAASHCDGRCHASHVALVGGTQRGFRVSRDHEREGRGSAGKYEGCGDERSGSPSVAPVIRGGRTRAGRRSENGRGRAKGLPLLSARPARSPRTRSGPASHSARSRLVVADWPPWPARRVSGARGERGRIT